MRETAAEDIRIHAAEGSSGGRETITRDRTPVPRERGGGEQERVSMSSSWAGYRRRGRCASSARAVDRACELLIPARNCRFHFAETRRRERYSSGGSVRSQATMASMSASFIFLK
jgi:hypothetical protein